MNKVIGVRFKEAGKKYYFDPLDFELALQDKVIVETVRGIELGEVMETIKTIHDEELISTLKPVIRKATNKDLDDHQKNQEAIPDVLQVCGELIRKHELEMKLLGAEYTLDRSKLIIYFTAEGRIDFRELVKDLATEFRLRIELRQVGARDGAKFMGGIGPCGYLLCCNTFLGEFETVSIKMAKNQNLSLNPSNISGLCGKLLCCIRYEDETYDEYRKTMPKADSIVKTSIGTAKVLSSNIIAQSVKLLFEDGQIRHMNIGELTHIKEFDTKTNDSNDNNQN